MLHCGSPDGVIDVAVLASTHHRHLRSPVVTRQARQAGAKKSGVEKHPMERYRLGLKVSI